MALHVLHEAASQVQQHLHAHLLLNLTRPSPKSSLLSIFLRSTLPVCSSTSRTLDWPLRPAETAPHRSAGA